VSKSRGKSEREREREREGERERGRGKASGEDVEVTIRNVEIQTDELRVTNWRADLRGCNWRCRAMGFTPVSKAKKRRHSEKANGMVEGKQRGRSLHGFA